MGMTKTQLSRWSWMKVELLTIARGVVATECMIHSMASASVTLATQVTSVGKLKPPPKTKLQHLHQLASSLSPKRATSPRGLEIQPNHLINECLSCKPSRRRQSTWFLWCSVSQTYVCAACLYPSHEGRNLRMTKTLLQTMLKRQ